MLALRHVAPVRATANPRHVLVLAALLPPVLTGGVHRPVSWFRHAARAHWRVTAVAHLVPRHESDAGRALRATIPADIPIHYVPNSELRPSWSAFPRIDGGLDDAVAMARHAARRLRHDPPAIVLATGPHFAAFVAGYLAARYFGCPLVLDYRDEWTESPFKFVRLGNADRAFERLCHRRADAVVFTTRAQLDHQVAAFPGLARAKCTVIANGWDSEAAAARRSAPRVSRDPARTTVSFAGTLGSHCPPDSFLATLARVLDRNPVLRARVRLRFVGLIEAEIERDMSRYKYADLIDRPGLLPKAEADALMAASDLLLLINDPALARYIPGKLYEYVASGTPILCYGGGGEIAAILEQTGVGCVVEADDDDALERVIATPAAPRRDDHAARRETWLAMHTREASARAMFALLERVVKDRSNAHAEGTGCR